MRMLIPRIVVSAFVTSVNIQGFAAAYSENAQQPEFTYPHSSVRYAKAITPSPQPTYADLLSMKAVAPNQTYTTWANTASPTDLGLYGNSALNVLWSPIKNVLDPPYTTTVSPTPVPSSELAFPPAEIYYKTNALPQHQKLPADFIWGLAGSALQVEGASKNEGRGPSLIDVLVHSLPLAGGLSPDISVLNYYLYKQDIARLAAVGVPYYSFSISWTRILPFGVPGSPVNQQGIDHYSDVINTCLEYGIIPIVTMCHFDTPAVFGTASHMPLYNHQNGGGAYNIGLNNDTIVDAFVNYARILFSNYADRVPYWITFNEPEFVSTSFRGVRNVVRLHAETVRVYREEVKGTGKISIKHGYTFGTPLNPSDAQDVEAANRYNDFIIGPTSYPFSFGKDYPPSVRDTLGTQLENYTSEELELANGSCDFYAIDAYTGAYITAPPNGISGCLNDSSDPHYPVCAVISPVGLGGWEIGYGSQSAPLKATPSVFRTFLNYIWKTYCPNEILLSEYGFPVASESEKVLPDALFDIDRVLFYDSYNLEIVKAIYEDGIKVIGAIAWAFLDNWEPGGSLRFGTQYVNFTTLERTYKSSMFMLVDFYDKFMDKKK